MCLVLADHRTNVASGAALADPTAHRNDLSDGAAAALGLIMAKDPLYNRETDLFTQRVAKPATVERARSSPTEVGLSSVCSLRVSIGAVYLALHMIPRLRHYQNVFLRYVVPACIVRQSQSSLRQSEDVVVASCRDIRDSGTVLVFHHTSAHPIRLTTKTLPELAAAPLRLQLALSEALPQVAASEPDLCMAVLASADVPWQEALLAEDHTYSTAAELLPADSEGWQPAVGKVHLTISLHASDPQRNFNDPMAGPMSTATDIHLRVELGRIHLRAATLRSVMAVVKLGPTQEISAYAEEETRIQGPWVDDVQGNFCCSAVSAEAVWRVDAGTGECLKGPFPPRLFIQLWRGHELLGLAKVQLAPLNLQEALNFCAGGRTQLLSHDVEVQSAATSAPLGTIHISLHAGVASGLAQAYMPVHTPALPTTETGVDFTDVTDFVDQESWSRMLASATVRLALCGTSPEEMVASTGADPQSVTSLLTTRELHMALLQLVDGVTKHEAATIAIDASDAIDPLVHPLAMVPLRQWRRVFQGSRKLPAFRACQILSSIRARVEAGVDRLLQEVGDARSVILQDLQGLGQQASLRRSGLSNLLRSRGMSAPWNVVEELFTALEGVSADEAGGNWALADMEAEVPARLLAMLMEKYAQVCIREAAGVRQLEARMVSRLRQLGSQGLATLLEPYARGDGKIDHLGLGLALEHMDNSSSDGQKASLAELKLVAQALVRQCASDSAEGCITVRQLEAWLHDRSMQELPPKLVPSELQQPPQMQAETGRVPIGLMYPPAPEILETPQHLGPLMCPPAPGILEMPQHLGSHSLQAVLHLMLPISEKALSDGFPELFVSCVADALRIPRSRVRVLRLEVGSPSILFEIGHGVAGDRTPEEVLVELAAQLDDPGAAIHRGRSGWHFANAILKQPPEADTRVWIDADEESVALRQLELAWPEQQDAQNLLARLGGAVLRGELDLARVAAVLNRAALLVSEHCPELWCGTGSPWKLGSAQLGRLLENDRAGAGCATAAWETLGLYAAPATAVVALWSLTRPSVVRAARMGASACPLQIDEIVVRAMLRIHHRFFPKTLPEFSDVQKQMFEVVFASGVDPVHAFSVLDRNGDGLVSLKDVVAMLRELDLPLGDADFAMAAQSMIHPTAGRIDVAEFAAQYKTWLQYGADGRRPIWPQLRERPMEDWSHDPFTSRRVEFLQQLPPMPSGTKCIALPGFVLFAFLDVADRGQVSSEVMRAFSEQCLGLAADSAARAVRLCDLTGRGMVSYKEFRRYLGFVDQHWCERMTQEEREEVGKLRADVCAALEIVTQPLNPTATAVEIEAEKRGADAVIAETLKRRGRDLVEGAPDAVGLEELLSDLRVPAKVAFALFEWQVAIGRVVAMAENGEMSMPPLTYFTIITALRRAQALLRSHLDALYGACFQASVDLAQVLDPWMRRPGAEVLAVSELQDALRQARVDLSNVDMNDVLRVLDPHQRGCFFAPELIQGYEMFKKRYKSLLGNLASSLGRSGLSPDELFARAAQASAASRRRAAAGRDSASAGPGVRQPWDVPARAGA